MIFISYSRHDISWEKRLLTQLAGFDDGAFLEDYVWSDNQIRAGEVWNNILEEARNNTVVAVMLVTAEFLASDFIRTNELSYFLENRENIHIYWFLVSDCPWRRHGLANIQCANGTDGSNIVPLDQIGDAAVNTVFARKCEEIYDLVKDLRSNKIKIDAIPQRKRCLPELKYFCNRDNESTLIELGYAIRAAQNNVWCFASTGDEEDDFDNLSATVLYKSLDYDIGQMAAVEVKIGTIYIAPVLIKYQEKFVSFLMKNIKDFSIDQSRAATYSICDLYKDYALPNKKEIIIFSINIKAADFYEQKFDKITDWIKTSFNIDNQCPLKVIFLFNLIKGSSEKEYEEKNKEMATYVKEKCAEVNLTNYETVFDGPAATIFNIGEHSNVTREAYDRWYAQYFTVKCTAVDNEQHERWKKRHLIYLKELFETGGHGTRPVKIRRAHEKLEEFINYVNQPFS
jgi:hypothetical protein